MNNYKSIIGSNTNTAEICYNWCGKDKSGLAAEGQIFAGSRTMAKALLIQKGNEPQLFLNTYLQELPNQCYFYNPFAI